MCFFLVKCDFVQGDKTYIYYVITSYDKELRQWISINNFIVVLSSYVRFE